MRSTVDRLAINSLTKTTIRPGLKAVAVHNNLGRFRRRRPSVAAFGWPSGIVLSSVFAVAPGAPAPPSASATPAPSLIAGQNPINPGLLGTASRQWTGAPWRAGQFSNFSGSFFPMFGIQGVQNYVYPQQPGGTVTRTPGTGPTITTDTGAGTGTTRSPDQQKSLS